MQRSRSCIVSGSFCVLLLGMSLVSIHAQSNAPEGELVKSNTVSSPLAMVVSNVPSVSNVPMTMVVSNLPPLGSNRPPVITNFTFVQQTNYGTPFYPTPPPKKPWWRRFWDWLW